MSQKTWLNGNLIDAWVCTYKDLFGTTYTWNPKVYNLIRKWEFIDMQIGRIYHREIMWKI